MKFLILNGPNLNIMRWSEPGVPGELDYNAIMDYVQAGCEQLGIETDCCQSNHEGDLVDEIQAAAGRVDGIVLNPRGLRPLQRGHSGCAAPVRRTRRGSDAARPGRAGAFPQDGRGILWLSGPLHRGRPAGLPARLHLSGPAAAHRRLQQGAYRDVKTKGNYHYDRLHQKGTPKDELEKIVDKFEKQGLDVTLITGKNYNVFGLVGDTTKIDERDVLANPWMRQRYPRVRAL